MRYFLDRRLGTHKDARREYLYDTFKTFFIELPNSSMNEGLARVSIVFQSFPTTFEENICIICGHNSFVAHILQNYSSEIPEKEIFIISCAHGYREQYHVKGKKVYLVPQINESVDQHSGKVFGFEFAITDAELNMFNNSKATAREKLLAEFNRI